MPTKKAAINSMPSMNMSIALRGGTSCGSGIPETGVSASDMRASSRCNQLSPARGRAPRSGGGGSARASRRTSPPAALRAATLPLAGEGEGSKAGVVLGQRRLQLFPDRVGIAAGLLHVGRPFLFERLGRLFPFVELRIRNLIDLAIRL